MNGVIKVRETLLRKTITTGSYFVEDYTKLLENYAHMLDQEFFTFFIAS